MCLGSLAKFRRMGQQQQQQQEAMLTGVVYATAAAQLTKTMCQEHIERPTLPRQIQHPPFTTNMSAYMSAYISNIGYPTRKVDWNSRLGKLTRRVAFRVASESPSRRAAGCSDSVRSGLCVALAAPGAPACLLSNTARCHLIGDAYRRRGKPTRIPDSEIPDRRYESATTRCHGGKPVGSAADRQWRNGTFQNQGWITGPGPRLGSPATPV